MKEEILKKIGEVLNKLAERLGTTAEYLWELMVYQSYVDSIMYATFPILTILLAIYIISFVKKGFKIHEKTYDIIIKDGYEIEFILFVISVILSLITSILTLLTLRDMVTGFLNPEYRALERIIDML